MRKVYPDVQADMAVCLAGGAEVVVYRQREVFKERGSANTVACTVCESPQAAKAVAPGLGLRVTT